METVVVIGVVVIPVPLRDPILLLLLPPLLPRLTPVGSERCRRRVVVLLRAVVMGRKVPLRLVE